jgi:hypothetical protein
MHQMRAIVFAISMIPRRQSRSNHRSPIVPAQGALPPMPGSSAACNLGWMGILVDRSRVLCGKATDWQPEHQNYDRGFPEIPHGPILMLILSAVLVTLVQDLIRSRVRPTLKIPARPKRRRKSRATVMDILATPVFASRPA